MHNGTNEGHRLHVIYESRKALSEEPRATLVLPVSQLRQLQECWQTFHGYTSDDWFEDVAAAIEAALAQVEVAGE